jgi:hypothetical protein
MVNCWSTQMPPEELARRNEPWQISDIDTREGGLLDDLAIFAANQPECLVPMLMRGGTLAGLLVLGARLSEDPTRAKIDACCVPSPRKQE